MTDPTPLADRLRASADEWLPTNDHSFRAHNLLTEAAAELERQAAELAELKDAARINLENYEFQRSKADKATTGLYSVHYALKDVGWHPGRTDDLLSDIIKARGAEAKADAARLDYLQQKQATISLVPDGHDDHGTRFAFMVGGWHCSVNRDARASIDAAIAASAA